VIEHKEPDRVPIDLGGTRATGIMAVAYAELKRYLGLTGGEIRVFDFVQQLAEVEEEVRKIFNVDAINIEEISLPPAPPDEIRWVDWILHDGTPAKRPADLRPSLMDVTAIPCPPGKGKFKVEKDKEGNWVIKWGDKVWFKKYVTSHYFTTIYESASPLRKAETKEDIDRFFEGAYDEKLQYPYLLTKEDCERLRKKAKYLYENTEYALVYPFGGNYIETSWFLRGYDKFWADLITRRSFVEYLFEKLHEYHMYNLKMALDAVKDYAQVVMFSDDMGCETGPLLSPKLHREMLFEYRKEQYEYVHKSAPRLYTFLHSCGSVYYIIPDLIEAGLDILNPVQIGAKNMEPERLKREFGDDLTFWGGGIDTQHVLPSKDPKTIEEHVKRNIQAFAPGGGFVFAAVHNIVAETPAENIVAAFEAAKKYGQYPIK